jgi:hypothetical protein
LPLLKKLLIEVQRLCLCDRLFSYIAFSKSIAPLRDNVYKSNRIATDPFKMVNEWLPTEGRSKWLFRLIRKVFRDSAIAPDYGLRIQVQHTKVGIENN